MKKFLWPMIFFLALKTFAYAQDDDSVPYMPYPQQQPQVEQPSTPQPAKTTPAKKKTPAKKTPAKKTTAKKVTTPPKPSTLEQGIALFKQDKYEQAGKYFLKAIQENKNNANAWYWYGVYHEKIGGYHQAQYFYSKAVALDPTIEQLSRVVYYPEDSEKTALWDPKRPARVYPVQTTPLKGTASVPAGISNFPTAPNDPELPKVPVYVPPDASASPIDGDTWRASVYVPPSVEEVYAQKEFASATATERQTLQFSMTKQNTEASEAITRMNGEPIYTPPAPATKVASTKKTTTKKQTAATSRKTTTTTQKKSTPAKKTTSNTTTKKVSQDVRPKQTPAPKPAPAQPVTPPPQVQTPPQAPAEHIEPMTPQYHEREQIITDTQRNYIPPVGQAVPDPGMISDAPIPPVGQNNL